MANFVILSEDNTVLNIAVAESLEIIEEITQAKCLEYNNNQQPHIGFAYYPETQTFEQPIITETRPIVAIE